MGNGLCEAACAATLDSRLPARMVASCHSPICPLAVILAAPVSSFPPKAGMTNKWSEAGIQLKYASGIAGHYRGEAAK